MNLPATLLPAVAVRMGARSVQSAIPLSRSKPGLAHRALRSISARRSARRIRDVVRLRLATSAVSVLLVLNAYAIAVNDHVHTKMGGAPIELVSAAETPIGRHLGSDLPTAETGDTDESSFSQRDLMRSM